MKVPLSWIRDFVAVPATAEAIGEKMSLRGLALEGIERAGDDAVLDFDVTANRPDCLSIVGIAREIATAYRLPLLMAPLDSATVGTATLSMRAASAGPVELRVTIDEADLCARYVAGVADVTVGPSPAWMQSRLLACGVRPISNVVDITNYVLLEMGHPMHAFDLAKLAGPAIAVRRARPGETMTTLDGKARTLDPEMLVIADAERAVGIAGVMGGADSEVSAATRQIVLESAWFKPQSVRATSKRLGLRTEASYRFERGADLTAAGRAMARATTLLELTHAGRGRGDALDVYPRPFEERDLSITAAAIRRLLGMDVPDAEIESILNSLGFRVSPLGAWQAAAPDAATAMSEAAHSWRVSVPGWRVDVQRPVDLIEEVGRHHGFEHLPSTFPPVEEPPAGSDPRIARDNRVRHLMLAAGLSEAVTFGFIETAAAEPFLGSDAPVVLANPLSEKFTTLRPSLLPGLVDAVSHNRRHGCRDVRLFEIGTRFSPTGESRSLAGAWTGVASPEHWSGPARQVDFFDVKGVAEQICASMDVSPEWSAVSLPFLVDGRSAEMRVNGTCIGIVGQLSPALGERHDLPSGDAVYLLEVNLDTLTAAASRDTKFARPLPRYPSVVRDVSVLVDDALSAETVRGTMRAAAPATLVEVREFDRYQGKGIAEGKVSLSLRLTFQATDRTLTDSEVQVAMSEIIAALTNKLGAQQR